MVLGISNRARDARLIRTVFREERHRVAVIVEKVQQRDLALDPGGREQVWRRRVVLRRLQVATAQADGHRGHSQQTKKNKRDSWPAP